MSKKNNQKNKDAPQAAAETVAAESVVKTPEKKKIELTIATELAMLQKEFIKLEQHNIHTGGRLLIILEGRDASGKDSTIKCLTQELSPRDIHVVALNKPSDRECREWYFKRFALHLPANGEIVFFNRSWYNRAGVEHVLNFCTKKQYQDFLMAAPIFEKLLVDDGTQILKYYLDISLKEQTKRLKDRKHDWHKYWKSSPIDDVAIKNWAAYSKARDVMLTKTNHASAPWHIVRSDNKPLAHLNLMRDILSHVKYAGKKSAHFAPDPKVVFAFDVQCLEDKLLQS
ncbi:MAG: polyphosphate kinase 2 [Cytophagales bacterium]|nr:polyphosphate kinase 2 [Cytophagales bacterium]